MNLVQPWLADHFWWVILLLALAVAATAYVFSKGEAAKPDKVRRQNPPD